MIQDFFSRLGIGCCYMFFDHTFQFRYIELRCYFFDINHLFVDFCIKITVHIQNVGNTATHTCCKVLSGLAKNCNPSTSHIFASMITDPFYNCCCSGVTDTETFACHTIDIGFSACCTIKRYVTNNNIFISFKFHTSRRINDQFTTGKSFTKIIIAVTGQFQCQTFWYKCSE